MHKLQCCFTCVFYSKIDPNACSQGVASCAGCGGGAGGVRQPAGCHLGRGVPGHLRAAVPDPAGGAARPARCGCLAPGQPHAGAAVHGPAALHPAGSGELFYDSACSSSGKQKLKQKQLNLPGPWTAPCWCSCIGGSSKLEVKRILLDQASCSALYSGSNQA